MQMPKQQDQYSDKEATKRMEDALRRALNTPHKPNKDFVGAKPKPPAKKSARSIRAKAAT
jgi:hypothetical protein